jgi:GPH family glycoside/pentoside/hexuronide:cation symporter
MERTQSVPIRSQLRTIAGNSHFRALIMIKVTHLLALSVGGGSLLFFFKFVIQRDLQTLGLYGALITIIWALAMPVWVRVAGRRGKRYGYFLATLAYSAIVLSWFFATADESNAGLVARGIAFGVVSGGLLLMGNAMLQDVMDDDFRRTESRKNGMFAGSYSMIEKITSGIGAQILGIVLSVSGFNRAVEVQTEGAIQGIYFAVAGVPGALMLISLFFIARYRLDESRLGS